MGNGYNETVDTVVEMFNATANEWQVMSEGLAQSLDSGAVVVIE